MSKKTIVDLSQYQKKKVQGKYSDYSDKNTRSFEEKLQDLIHRPLNEPGLKHELITIFEEVQLKEDMKDKISCKICED